MGRSISRSMVQNHMVQNHMVQNHMVQNHMVQNHGGRLWAEANEGPGTGFQFTVPVHDEGLRWHQPPGPTP